MLVASKKIRETGDSIVDLSGEATYTSTEYAPLAMESKTSVDVTSPSGLAVIGELN